MSEKFSRPESAPEVDPYKACEAIAKGKQWSSATEETLRALLESHEAEMYMIYLNYKESGLLEEEELSEHELRLYNWLKEKFKEVPE